MALTSPWNVAFWLAAMGRPELAGAKAASLLVMAAAVIAGALTWGVIWATANALLHRSLEGGTKRAWTTFVDLATGLLDALFRRDLGTTALEVKSPRERQSRRFAAPAIELDAGCIASTVPAPSNGVDNHRSSPIGVCALGNARFLATCDIHSPALQRPQDFESGRRIDRDWMPPPGGCSH